MEERDYNEVYDNGNNLLEVFVHIGDNKVFAATNRNTRERKVFRTLQDLESFLYNRGYHIIISDRRQFLMRNMALCGPRDAVRVATRPDGSAREICFLNGWKTHSGWVLGISEDSNKELIVRSNVNGAYTNAEGYKTVTVPVENIILLSDY
jgi:hypothetical protein